jgi:tetratricopeptide (TPR) repeat protein
MPLRARASCALAESLDLAGQHARAESLTQEGLREINDDPQFSADRVFCLLNRVGLDFNGFGQESVARAQSAYAVLNKAPFASSYLRLTVMMELASAYHNTTQLGESVTAYERASALLTQLGYDDTDTASELLGSWAEALLDVGRPKDAEAIYRRAMDVGRARYGSKPNWYLLIRYADALGQLNSLQEAADFAQNAYNLSSNQGLLAQDACLLNGARISIRRHDYKRAASMLDQAQKIQSVAIKPGHYGYGTYASLRSLIAEDTKHFAAALQLANQAVEITEASVTSGGQGAIMLPRFLTRRAALEVELGQMDKAVTDAERAVGMMHTYYGKDAFSAFIGQADVELGRALRALGKSDEARTAFRSATEHLDRTLGSNHPETCAARQLAGLIPEQNTR